jgi:hypothetical protein
VQVCDVGVGRLIKKMWGHSARVGALSWTGDIAYSGILDLLVMSEHLVCCSKYICRKILAQFTSLTKVLFTHITKRKTVPTHGISVAPNYPISCYIMYLCVLARLYKFKFKLYCDGQSVGQFFLVSCPFWSG